MMLIFKLVILKLFLILNLVFINISFADNHNIYETLEIIKNDLKTLERAVYSGSIELKTTTNNSSITEIDSNSEDVLTRHLLKLSEVEDQFRQLTNKFECDIQIGKEELIVDAKSILGLLSLAASYNTEIEIETNGSDEKNSIQVVGNTHKLKLFNHQWVDGQGFFKINNINKMIKEDDIHTVKTEESECLIFHPLTIHRSVPVSENIDLRPRYSLDIRYFDDNLSIKKVNVDFRVKLKKIFRGLI